MAADNHSMMMRAIADTAVIDLADAPLPGQGETEAKSTPATTSASTSEVAAATTAPARMAAQDTADALDSTAESSRVVRCAIVRFSIRRPALVVRAQCKEQDDWNRYAQ